MVRNPLTLTDDNIDSFVAELVKWLDLHPYLFNDRGEVSDEGYDYLKDFVEKELQPFSNGYKNYN